MVVTLGVPIFRVFTVLTMHCIVSRLLCTFARASRLALPILDQVSQIPSRKQCCDTDNLWIIIHISPLKHFVTHL